jgi:hypothetical protein
MSRPAGGFGRARQKPRNFLMDHIIRCRRPLGVVPRLPHRTPAAGAGAGRERTPGPGSSMRRNASLALLAATLMVTACDSLKLPPPPAKAAPTTTTTDTQPARTATKPAPAKRAVKADPSLEGARFEQIRRGLRRLVVAEETYYAENGIYTEDLARIGFKPERDTQVRFLWVSRTGWAASGTHDGVPNQDCVIFVGRGHGAPTTLRYLRTGAEGVPVCDATPARRRPPPPATTSSSEAPSPPATPPAPAPEAPAPAAAAAAPALPDTGSALDAVAPRIQMRVDLRNLVRSQDGWFSQQGTYSKRSEPFALQYLWHRGVKITILSANDDSWSARATHAAWPGRSCVIWLGPVLEKPATDIQRRVPDKPGVPVCDD